MDLKKEAEKVKCPKCEHEFKTRSKLNMITCNDCGDKFKRDPDFLKKKRDAQ